MLVLSSLAAPDLHLIYLRFIVSNAWCVATRVPCGGYIGLSDNLLIWIDEDSAWIGLD